MPAESAGAVSDIMKNRSHFDLLRSSFTLCFFWFSKSYSLCGLSEFNEEGNRALLHYVIGITSFVVLLLLCCTLQCFVCRRLRRKRRYDENFEPLHYPSSTLQFVRFSHNRREQQKMNATTFDIPCNDQK